MIWHRFSLYVGGLLVIAALDFFLDVPLWVATIFGMVWGGCIAGRYPFCPRLEESGSRLSTSTARSRSNKKE